MKKISVILPCFNVSKYVEKAIESLLVQEHQWIEVIAVDDGSTDNTWEILKKNYGKNKRVIILHQENQGYGTAVNTGLAKASGDYVAILEPDDYLDNDYYGPLIAAAEGMCADVVFYNSYFECRQGFRNKLVTTYHTNRFYGNLLLSNDEICTRLALGNVGICFAIYNRLFLIENNIVLDDSSRAYEDVPFVASVLNMAEKVAIVPGGGYYYNRDIPGQSVTNQRRFASILKVTQRFFDEKRLKPTREAAIRGYFLKHLAVYWNKSADNVELRDNISKLMTNIANNYEIICEEWTYNFLAKQIPNAKFFAKNKLPIVSRVVDIKDLPPLVKVLNEGSYFQFLGYARYKLARLLDEKSTSQVVMNEVYALLNTPNSERNTIIQDFLKDLLRGEDFSGLYKINNALTVKIMAKARSHGVIPDLSVYCEDATFLQHLIEDSQIANYAELQSVETLRPIRDFYSAVSDNERLFRNYIKGKSIAVVGNSPCELNKNKGVIIDSHDIVIRFNNFEVSERTAQDYGFKTSVWACTPTLESLRFRENAGCMDFLVVPRTNSYMPKFRLDYLLDVKRAGYKILMFDTEKYMRKYDMRVFSLGLLMLLWLMDNRDLVKSISIFGFSLTDQLKGVKHYFSGDPSAGKQLSFHKWSKEAIILNSLIEEGLVKKC